jgi:hypothetical protein
MKKETLKELIEIEFDRCETISHFKKEVFRLIDLYDNDKEQIINFYPNPTLVGNPDKVPYFTICSCNPANGGSGICGCTMANTMVDNPKK